MAPNGGQDRRGVWRASTHTAAEHRGKLPSGRGGWKPTLGEEGLGEGGGGDGGHTGELIKEQFKENGRQIPHVRRRGCISTEREQVRGV